MLDDDGYLVKSSGKTKNIDWPLQVNEVMELQKFIIDFFSNCPDKKPKTKTWI